MITDLGTFAFHVLAPVLIIGAALAGGMIRWGGKDDDDTSERDR